MSSITETGARKLTSFWDPLYNPGDQEEFTRFNWDFSKTIGLRHSMLAANDLKKIPKSDLRPFASLDLKWCIFRGHFSESHPIAFNKCTFESCDFGYSTWENTKFSNCKFTRCSFTLTTIKNCEFIDCTWIDIGINGASTKISDTLITNPDQFIAAAYTNTNEEILRQNNTNKSHQIMRLEKSKSKIARLLLRSLENLGDDNAYYLSVKTYLLQNISAQIAEKNHSHFNKQNPRLNKFLASLLMLEKSILIASGVINAWGKSIARPTLIGAGLITLFAFIYYATAISPTIPRSLMTSFDVTLLIGYTKQATSSSPKLDQCLYAANAFLGLWWYAVIVPTIINRISRAR